MKLVAFEKAQITFFHQKAPKKFDMKNRNLYEAFESFEGLSLEPEKSWAKSNQKAGKFWKIFYSCKFNENPDKKSFGKYFPSRNFHAANLKYLPRTDL